MKNKTSLFMVQGALIAALYVVLTLLSSMLGLACMPFQVRFSEALAFLPIFVPSAIPGLFVGCVISNLITGAVPLDVIFGSLATLIGALGTYLLRNHKKLCLLPPIIANTLIIPPILVYAYGIEGTLPLFMLTVGLGEVISCGVLGYIFCGVFEKYKDKIFRI